MRSFKHFDPTKNEGLTFNPKYANPTAVKEICEEYEFILLNGIDVSAYEGTAEMIKTFDALGDDEGAVYLIVHMLAGEAKDTPKWRTPKVESSPSETFSGTWALYDCRSDSTNPSDDVLIAMSDDYPIEKTKAAPITN